MSALSAQWAQWDGKFAALTRRERAIVAAAMVFGGGMIVFNFGIEPFLLKARTAAKAELAAHTELAQQRALLAMLAAQNTDPDAPNRSRLAQAKQDLAAVSERLARFEAGMVPPARMQAFLEGLLARNRTIELLGLKTLPVTLVGAPVAAEKTAAAAGAAQQAAKDPGKEAPTAPAGAASAPADGIYQHGIEIRLAGSFNDLLGYLAELERMPQRVMWNSVSLTVEKYPRNVMVLRVYTLSLDRNWLVV
jgi:MSHA biogenesis protein MshJ